MFKGYIGVLKAICDANEKEEANRFSLHFPFGAFSLHFSIANLHKETTCVFFHYWRRREPPVSLSIGDSRCSFAIV